MSKNQDKKLKNKIEHAEFLWHQAQLKAAAANTELNIAVEVFKDLSIKMSEDLESDEMTEEQIKATEEQVSIQRKRIEEYLMAEKELYLERIGVQQD